MSILRFEAVLQTDRTAALMAAADGITGSGGWIVDHTLFSDVMAVIAFCVPANRTTALGDALAAAGILVSPPLPPSLPETDEAAERELQGQLTLTFAKGTGDLRHEVPAFE
ncbi:hypothetical protein Sp245p_13190 [Azospirillum baldaniorum]|uniref:Uncharacterized protein n=1 Tax=Azospirillum baldaniorum TaxID=1064539 RepID=A0A9P1JP97_9PROT|nr:hypothetical protein [Azospirillum baldaniorum]AWJ90676.1 hypothetical protein Sp245p_13190 [Azospirillum baldaniorum]TWA78895.1 hypothetical protein FBZ85_105200 [Azospirillum brasilense]CCC97118.1 conserved protein of unknown function [Azospirillum baldaniorum]